MRYVALIIVGYCWWGFIFVFTKNRKKYHNQNIKWKSHQNWWWSWCCYGVAVVCVVCSCLLFSRKNRKKYQNLKWKNQQQLSQNQFCQQMNFLENKPPLILNLTKRYRWFLRGGVMVFLLCYAVVFCCVVLVCCGCVWCCLCCCEEV